MIVLTLLSLPAALSSDPYGMSKPYCTPAEKQREVAYFAANQAALQALPQADRDLRAIEQIAGVDGTAAEHFGACLESFMTQYLNRSDVLAAIHVNRSNTSPVKKHSSNNDWQPSSGLVGLGAA